MSGYFFLSEGVLHPSDGIPLEYKDVKEYVYFDTVFPWFHQLHVILCSIADTKQHYKSIHDVFLVFISSKQCCLCVECSPHCIFSQLLSPPFYSSECFGMRMKKVRIWLTVLLMIMMMPFLNAYSELELSPDELILKVVKDNFFYSQLSSIWFGSSPCRDWIGVICNNEAPTSVIALHLSNMQLKGYIPELFSHFHHLEELWLDNNYLCGTVPMVLGNLAYLRSLKLHGNMLKGFLAERLRRIPNLTYDSNLICNYPEDLACRELVLKNNPMEEYCKFDLLTSKLPNNLGQMLQNDSSDDIKRNMARYSEIDKTIWPCVCDLDGEFGTQAYSISNNSFSSCLCRTSCPSCVTGQVLEPFIGSDNPCRCVAPMLIVVKFVKMQMYRYSLEMERNFTNNFAAIVHISPSQVVPVARHGENVTLYLYILPRKGTDNGEEEIRNIEAYLIQKNATDSKIFEDPGLGSIFILKTEYPIQPRTPASSKFFYPPVMMSVVLVAVAFAVSVVCFVRHRKKIKGKSQALSIEKDSSSTGLTNLISQGSSLREEVQCDEHTSIRHSRGFVGRAFSLLGRNKKLLAGTKLYQFSYSDLTEATQCFSKDNIVGMGGSSYVYRGRLKDGQEIAVKKLNFGKGFNSDADFLSEVDLSSRLHHFHLVSLLGYCMESHRKQGNRLLVYEYMCNGNLRAQLDGNLQEEPVDWSTRVRIALGAARGLEYLHESASPRVLHCDFKSSNILLDAKWRAKVADFGMAKTITKDGDGHSKVPMKLLGTFGYFAPEYAMIGTASLKSDVYSFGVVLLELITGRRPIDMSLPKGEQSLVIWAIPLLQNDNTIFKEMADSNLKNGFPKEDLIKMAHVARACLQMDPDLRPKMTAVVQVLATLIPSNARKTNLPPTSPLGHFTLPKISDCCDYDFSREDLELCEDSKLSDEIHIYKPDIHKMCSQRLTWSPSQLSKLEEIIDFEVETKVCAPKNPLSCSTSNCHKSSMSLPADDPACKSQGEESLDITKPQMEKLWLHTFLI